MSTHAVDVAALERMVDDIRAIRERTCDPKSHQNPRYLALSNAVSNLNKAIGQLSQED